MKMNLTQNQTLILLIQTLCEIESQHQAQQHQSAVNDKNVPVSRLEHSGPLAFINEMIRVSTEKHSFQDKASEQAFYNRIQTKQKKFLNIYFDQLEKKNLNIKIVKQFFKKNDIDKLNLSTVLNDSGIKCQITPEQANRLFWEIKD